MPTAEPTRFVTLCQPLGQAIESWRALAFGRSPVIRIAAGCVGSHNGFLLLGLLPVVLVTGLGSGVQVRLIGQRPRPSLWLSLRRTSHFNGAIILGVLGEQSTRLLASPPGRASSWLNSRNTRTAPAWHELPPIGIYPSRIHTDRLQCGFARTSLPLRRRSLRRNILYLASSGTSRLPQRRLQHSRASSPLRHDHCPTLRTSGSASVQRLHS